MENVLFLDGESLTIEKLMRVDEYTQVDFTKEAWERIRKSRKVITDVLEKGDIVYGINTGFGNFSDVIISNSNLEILQENLIRSHASGVGDLLSVERTKRLCTLRLNVFAKGYSGIGEESIKRIMEFYNKNCLSAVPEKGTVGASGDLAPLSHLALGFMGEGKLWNPKKLAYEDAEKVIAEFSLTPIKLQAKEGLALINGTQFITALAAEALYRAINIAKSADIICALSLEALEGTSKAYLEKIHKTRPHKGQILSAKTMRSILHNEKFKSDIHIGHSNCGKVQDAYCLRCAPQVHGVAYDTILYVKGIIETEMNSATDNPMVFSEDGTIVSGGNFHGEYPAKACDFLAIAIHELSNISERRIERLLNTSLSGLPPFLVKEGGLNSGFMIAHCTAAALVSENKTLCHPGSVDSIPTSASKEDHVSMGGWCARKCLQVVDNVEMVLSIEYLAACQGLYLRRPSKSTEPLEATYELLRSSGVAPLEKDRIMYDDIAIANKILKEGKLVDVISNFVEFDEIM